MKVIAINDFKIFKKGDEYEGAKINNNWYLIEAISVTPSEYKNNFKEVVINK